FLEDVGKNGLERFWVLFADHLKYADLLRYPSEPNGVMERTTYTEVALRWWDLLSKLHQRFNKAEIAIGLMWEPVFYGAHYFDWEAPGGRITIRPFIWGLKGPECPSYESEWKHKNAPREYRDYRAGLENLVKRIRGKGCPAHGKWFQLGT